MNPAAPIKILFFISTLILFYSCSSSSYQERYSKPKDTEKPKSPKVRFTSENDIKPDTTLSRVAYNISDSLQSEFDEIPFEDVPVNTEAFVSKFKNLSRLSPALTQREKVLMEVIKYLDTPYKYGGNDFHGIDCSSFTQNVFGSSLNITLPRTASEQFQIGENITSKNDLKFGDLVFFNTSRRSKPGHVGIYIGEDLFAHASRSQGVTVSSMQSTYYKLRYIGAARITPNHE